MLSDGTIVKINSDTITGFGLNTSGQLGIGNYDNSPSVVNIPITNVKEIVGGNNYTFFLLNDGTVKGCGNNTYYQLGLPNTGNFSTIQNIPITNVKKIVCGWNHTFFLLNDGTVKGCGYNNSGQLVYDNTNFSSLSLSTIIVDNVRDIVCGSNTTFFMINDGTVKVCGINNQGQLGLGHNTSPINTLTTLPISNIKNIVVGGSFTIFLFNDGTVKGCGSNNLGQLGLGHNTSPIKTLTTIPITNVKKIACGTFHSMFLLNDGSIMGCGDNSNGQLALGTTNNTGVTTISGLSNSSEKNVVNIVCGTQHTLFLNNKGNFFGCGMNTYGQLGLGHNNSPVLSLDVQNLTIESLINMTVDEFVNKYLIKDGDLIKKINSSGAWETIKNAPVTVADFDNAMDNLNSLTNDMIQQLSSNIIEILNRIDTESINPTMTAFPKKAQTIKPLNDIDISDVFRIESFKVNGEFTGTGKAKVVVSVDSGTTWKTFNTNWSTIDINNLYQDGIDINTFNNIPQNKWNELRGTSNTIRFAYAIKKEAYTDKAIINSIEMNCDFIGKWSMAVPAVDYNYAYPDTKTLEVEFLKDGNYKVNYME